MVSKRIVPDYGYLYGSEIEGVYHIGSEIVFFISTREKKTPTLLRLRMDDKTGDITDLITVGTLIDYSFWEMMSGRFAKYGFYVRHDEVTGNT